MLHLVAKDNMLKDDDKKTSHVKVAQEVLKKESQALLTLSDSLGESFDKIVHLLTTIKGRIIVSGVGKSGHVGRKIAATFASTGQPAFFVHSAEAGHGDLGMITADDVLLLISHSGEAKELNAMIAYAHRFEIPIIAITSKKESMLAKQSTSCLLLPNVQEACPLGLAPTTSTTLTMALGDALAIALLSHKGFTRNDFSTFHPGGHLGFQLKRIQDFMHTNVPLIHEDASLLDCLKIMTTYKLGCVGVIDEHHHLKGIITDGDIRRLVQENLNNQSKMPEKVLKAQDVMTPNPITIREEALLGDALALFEKRSITNVFVMSENQKVIGLLHVHDCLRTKAL